MGACGSTAHVNADAAAARASMATNKVMFKVDVTSVQPIPTGELAAFMEKYIDLGQIPYSTEVEGEKYVSERIKDCATVFKIQNNRWDWAQANKDTFVNMLRVCGHSDANIQAMCDGRRPLNFRNAAIHAEFCKSLGELGRNLEKEMGWKSVRFMQAGSSVPGYSSNPVKGKRDQASKITSATKSDVDIVIIGEGVGAWARKRDDGKWFESDLPFNQRGERPLFNPKEPKEICNLIKVWLVEWEEKLQAAVQITFCEHPNPMIYKWQCCIDTDA